MREDSAFQPPLSPKQWIGFNIFGNTFLEILIMPYGKCWPI